MADFRKWRIEFEEANNASDRRLIQDPPGFDYAASRQLSTSSSSLATKSKEAILETRAKKQEALYARASGQFKNIGMMAFMMWMSGSQLHIFSIMTTVSGLYQPLNAILNSADMFPPEEDPKLDRISPWILYCCIHGLGLAYAAYKLAGMGLLPTHISDFVSALVVPSAQEYSSGGLLQS